MSWRTLGRRIWQSEDSLCSDRINTCRIPSHMYRDNTWTKTERRNLSRHKMMDTASLNDSQIINQRHREHKDAYRNVTCIRNAIKGMGRDFSLH